MANPSLKAQIEAAKSALESGQTGTPADQGKHNSTTSKIDAETTSVGKTNKPSIAEPPINSGSNAAMLDARIISLETKLAENQRDLYTLLGKVREITRLHKGATKNTRPKNSSPKDVDLDNHNVTRQKGRIAAITLAVFTGIIIGAGFFLADDFVNQLFVHLPSWVMGFVDFIDTFVE